MLDTKDLTAVDLFCGCGGISCGLRQAGFKILAGVDLEPKYMRTFEHNFPESKCLRLDLAKVPPEEFMDLVGLKAGELDMLAGGPPCQGFSKNVPRRHRYLSDPNNRLIKAFLDYCQTIRPALILMENVAEMKNGFDQAYTDEIERRLEDDGYTVTYEILNAADYGVPQRRRRAFFVASRVGTKFALPRPTHAKPLDQLTLFSMPRHVSVWEAIGDLPRLENGQGQEKMPYACAPFTEYQNLMRDGLERVTNHVARHLRPKQYQRLASLEPGQAYKDLPIHLKVKSGYSGAYGRLTKDMIAPTITRWVFHPGSGRWGHPVDIRVLSIREVARIQSFPDNFEFRGTYLEQAAQLGNAVPPLLVRRLAESILNQLSELDRSKSCNKSSRDIFSVSDGRLNMMQ